MRSGFTLLEIVITVAILAILVAAASPVLRGVVRKGEIDSFSQNIIFDLKQARARSMSGDGGLKWGLHLVSVTSTRSFYQVFSSPSNYNDQSSTVQSATYLPLLIHFTSPAPSSTQDIIFDKIRGTIPASTTIIFSNPVDNQIRTINLNASGNIY